MYYSFQLNESLRAGRARFVNLVHSVGGINRHTFVIGNTIQIEADRCTEITREEAHQIENAFVKKREARIAAAKLAYFQKVRT